MPQAQETLAQKVRAKHPGAYDDLSDQQLETAVMAKYPGVYDDLPRTGAKPPETSPAPVTPSRQPLSATIAEMAASEAERTRPGQEFVTGAAKRIAEMGVKGGAMLRKIPGVSAVADLLPSVEVPIERTTGMERAGATAADLATITRFGGAASALTRGMALPVRMAAEGASMAGVAKVQGADPLAAGVMGAAIPAAGAVLTKATQAIPQSLRDQATKKVAQALGATKERFKALAEKRAPEILKRGLRGSRARLLKDATAHAQEAGQAVDDALLATHGVQRLAIAPIDEALEEAKQGFLLTRRLTVGEAAKEGLLSHPGLTKVGENLVELRIVLDPRPIEQLSRLQQTLRELGKDASVEQIVALRRVWDDVVARAGGFAHRQGATFGVPLAEQTEAWAKREGTNAIRKLLADEVPDLAKVNAEYAFWTDLKDILTATQARTKPQGPGLSRVIGGVVGGATAYGKGEDPTTAITSGILAGYLTPKVIGLLTSANWRLINAGLRNSLATALESGSPGQIMSAATRIAAVKGSNRKETSASSERP